MTTGHDDERVVTVERAAQPTPPPWEIRDETFVTFPDMLDWFQSTLAQPPRLRVWMVERDDSTGNGGIVCITGNGPAGEANAWYIAEMRRQIATVTAERDAAVTQLSALRDRVIQIEVWAMDIADRAERIRWTSQYDATIRDEDSREGA